MPILPPISWLRRMVFFCAAAGFAAAEPAFELFAMDNGVGRGVWTPAQQAGTLQELGYRGISYNYTSPSDLAAWLVELKQRKLELYGLYFPIQLSAGSGLPPGFEEAVRLLRGTNAVLWATVPAPNRAGDHESAAIDAIRRAADLAATAGLRVILYPHKGFYIATAEQAWSLVQKSERANVGLTVNLAHELAAGNGARVSEIIRRVAPGLELVTINGASDRPGPGWDNYIKRLGEGDYDIEGILRTLEDVNYRGPVGLQFYNVKGDPRANLAAARRAWTTLRAANSR